MKTLLIFPFAPPERGSPVMRVESIRQFFEQKGEQVLIACPKRNTVEAPGVLRYNGLFGLLELILKENPDVVIGSSPPMTHSAIGMLFSKLLGKRVFLDVRDPWTYATVRLRIYKPHQLKVWLYRFLEKIGYTLSEKVFSVSAGVSAHIMRHVPKNRIILAPNGTLPEVFNVNAARREKKRKQLGIKKNQPVVLFAGDFWGMGLESLLPRLLNVLERNNGFLVLLIPINEWPTEAKQIVFECKKALKDAVSVIDLPKLELKEVAEHFAACDIGLAVNPPALDYCIPAKVYDYAACGVYTVGFSPNGHGLEKLLTENDMGTFASNDAEFTVALGKAFKRIQSDSEIKKRLHELAVLHFDRAKTSKIIWKHVTQKNA